MCLFANASAQNVPQAMIPDDATLLRMANQVKW